MWPFKVSDTGYVYIAGGVCECVIFAWKYTLLMCAFDFTVCVIDANGEIGLKL